MKTVSKAFPIARNISVVQSEPIIRHFGKMTSVTHHELITSVSGSSSFSSARYESNPGISTTFPWLYALAQKYEKYRFRRLELVYIPSKAVVTTPGTVYLSVDYDPDDAAPSSEAAISTYETLASGRPFDEVRVRVDLARVQNAKMKVRSGPRAGSKLLYDPCSLLFGTVDMADGSAVGKLYVDYEIELISPQTAPASPLPVAFSMWTLASAQTFTSTVAATMIFDEEIVNGLGVTNTNGSFALPEGLFKVQLNATFKDTSAEVLSAILQVYLDGSALSIPQTVHADDTVSAGGSLCVSLLGYVSAPSGGATLTINCTLTGAAGTLTSYVHNCRLALEAMG
jgi:hypothetical protein